jgi:hypothetical protein
MGVLNMTKEQLQSAPDFHYVPTPTADAGPSASPPAAAPAMAPSTTQKPSGASPAAAN